MIEFVDHGKFGYPWHGLRTGDGKVQAQSGVKIFDHVGTPPSNGSCYLLQVPGAPAVSTSADEVLAGMTWTNYALVSGDNHVLYGRELGANTWIAVIDGRRVLCRLDIGGVSGDRHTLTNVRVHFRDFGHFRPDGTQAEQVTAALGDVALTMDVTDDRIAAWSPSVTIYDISPDGQRVLLVMTIAPPAGPAGTKCVLQVMELTVSWAGAWVVDIAKVRGARECHPLATHVGTTVAAGVLYFSYALAGDSPFHPHQGAVSYSIADPISSNVRTFSSDPRPALLLGGAEFGGTTDLPASHTFDGYVRRAVVGARFAADGAVQVIEVEVQTSGSGAGTTAVEPYRYCVEISPGAIVDQFCLDHTVVSTRSSIFKLLIDGSPVAETTVAVAATTRRWITETSSGVEQSSAWSINDVTVATGSVPDTFYPGDWLQDGFPFDLASAGLMISPIDVRTLFPSADSGEIGRISITAFRATNAVYLLQAQALGAGQDFAVSNGSIKTLSVAGKYSVDLTARTGQIYCTEHPVTQELSIGSNARCFV